MFARRLSIQQIDSSGAAHACPIRWIDNFAMRNFTNDAVFDDTLPARVGCKFLCGNRGACSSAEPPAACPSSILRRTRKISQGQ